MLVAMIAIAAITILTSFVLRPRDDTPTEPDAVVVLGGVGVERFDLGLALAHELNARLVLSSSATYFAARRGYRCGSVDDCLLDPKSTTEEARAVAELATRQGWEHVTVVSSSHHTTRARVLFRQCLGDHVSVVGAPRPSGVSFKEWAWEVAGTLAALTVRRAC
jgi:uncharacterized protein YfiM (DUF2279 family)